MLSNLVKFLYVYLFLLFLPVLVNKVEYIGFCHTGTITLCLEVVIGLGPDFQNFLRFS